MTRQHPIDGRFGNLTAQCLFIGSLDPADFQNSASLRLGQKLLEQMLFFFQGQILLITSSFHPFSGLCPLLLSIGLVVCEPNWDASQWR